MKDLQLWRFQIQNAKDKSTLDRMLSEGPSMVQVAKVTVQKLFHKAERKMTILSIHRWTSWKRGSMA